MQPIQPAVSVPVPSRTSIALIVVVCIAVFAPRALIAPTIPIVPPTSTATGDAALIEQRLLDPFDADWFHADYLARLIEARRYGAIEAAAAAIAPGSRYAPWVPVAVAIALDQVEATAIAYARMGMCGELNRMYAQLEAAWPQASAMIEHIYCERHIRVEKEQRYAELVDELAAALVDRDHRHALATCAAMHEHGALPATCLAEACKAGEVALAEVLFAHLEHRRGERVARVTSGDLAARHACERAGITFDDEGTAHVTPWQAFRGQPFELVRVHPDAPASSL